MNEYYDHTTFPAAGSSGSSSAMRAELDAIEDGFDKLPTMTGNAGKVVVVNGSGTGLESTSAPALVDASITQTGGTGVLQAPYTASPAQTAEGSMVWDSDDDKMTVGTGAGRKTLVDTDSAQTLTNKTIGVGQLSGQVAVANGGTGSSDAGSARSNLSAQETLVSGTNIKTINGTSLLGSGNLVVSGGIGSYPGAGIAVSTGSAWGTSKTAPSGDLVGTTDTQTVSNKQLSSCTVDGTNGVGYLNIPQNSKSANYTLLISDAGKHVYHPSSDTSARVFTIPANSSVAFPVGTAVTFINDTSAGTITISITSDTLVFLPSGGTGSRSLAAGGIATAIKVTTTRWVISGLGIT